VPLRLRSSVIKRSGKTYRYYQLVRAMRRDGKPTHEVVAHVGRLSDGEAQAIRDGLRARQGVSTGAANGPPPVMAPSGITHDAAPARPGLLDDIVALGALRYLDVQLVCNLFDQWGLGEFFSKHLEVGQAEMAPADVVRTLVVNRCLAPCSKLRVTEWTPRTALPEILGFRPGHLNNTRIHRVLGQLEDIEPTLTRFLVAHPLRRTKADSVIYLDLTSTWFEGHGGDLGERGRTKDGAIRRHVIQIALAVDVRGLPLQWEVLPGKTAEVTVLPRWIALLASHPELESLPLSFDRGLASEENLRALVAGNRKFVTCSRQSRIEDWKLGVDLEAIAATPESELPERKALEQAGLHGTDEVDIYHVDCGVRALLGTENPKGKGSPPPLKLRVVPYFRPSLFHRNRDSLRRLRTNVLGKVNLINQELRKAKAARKEETTRKRVTSLLSHFQVEDEFTVRLDAISLPGKTKPVCSFEVHLEPVAQRSTRELNAGWMLLLAHPEDERSPLELIQQYHHKEVVEHAFGLIKSFVQLRPIHHQTTPKIRAHVTLCILGLLLDRWLELKLREADITDAVDRVYEALEPCRLHVLSSHRLRQRTLTLTATTPHQRRLLEALGLTHLVQQDACRALHPRRN